MKNQNQVRKNGSAPRAARQAKTIGQNVTIVITEKETGEVAAKFEVQKSFHDAMFRDALEKGISVQQWVENAVKKKTAKPQPKPAAPVNGDNEISLVLFSAKYGTSVAQIDVTGKDFVALTRRAAIGNCSLEKLLVDALDRMTKDVPILFFDRSSKRWSTRQAETNHEKTAPPTIRRWT